MDPAFIQVTLEHSNENNFDSKVKTWSHEEVWHLNASISYFHHFTD